MVNFNTFRYTDMIVFFTKNIQEIAFKNDNSSSIINIKSFKAFSKSIHYYLFSNFYYKNELDSTYISNNIAHLSLIVDNANYIQEKTQKSTVEDWSIYYFLTLLNKKKEKIFLKHLIFNKNYLLTFKWLSLTHNLHIFNSKM